MLRWPSRACSVHGLRASELCELTWNMIELDSGRIHVRRAKNGVDSTHRQGNPGTVAFMADRRMPAVGTMLVGVVELHDSALAPPTGAGLFLCVADIVC
jgi:integrase